MSRFEQWLRKHVSFKEIGWKEIGEEFTRFQLLKTRWFNVYLHKLYAPNWHPECHDHPWSFISIILKNGYIEETAHKIEVIRPGRILYRPAVFAHNVVTPSGPAWSLIFTTKKQRDWGFVTCAD